MTTTLATLFVRFHCGEQVSLEFTIIFFPIAIKRFMPCNTENGFAFGRRGFHSSIRVFIRSLSFTFPHTNRNTPTVQFHRHFHRYLNYRPFHLLGHIYYYTMLFHVVLAEYYNFICFSSAYEWKLEIRVELRSNASTMLLVLALLIKVLRWLRLTCVGFHLWYRCAEIEPISQVAWHFAGCR